ncbi:hypothetical protein CJ030_MR7G016706 [Morella rubra]|nr:hypothetical protein CJ030_MR7G016706 [Morella rubra]
MQTVQNFVDAAGAPNIWLTGHSLGSAIALLVGKNMCKRGYFVETYLFNPPFLSAPIESWIKDHESLKDGVRLAKSLLTAGLALAVQVSQHHESQEHDSFAMLCNWIPYLFVNPADHICAEYIGYFENRKKMVEMGAGIIERLATKNSIRSLVSGALGGDSEVWHLLPSAYLTTFDLGPSPDFMRAHGINQWWNPNFPYKSTLHSYDHL